MGGPTSSYAAAGIALEFIGAHKPPHPAGKCCRQGVDTIEGVTYVLNIVYFSCADSVVYQKLVVDRT
jgi:hypothetical protein